MSYIKSHDLSNKILDLKNCKTEYTIEESLREYFYYDSCFFHKTFNLNIPSKTRINTFSIEKAHNEFINIQL